MPILNDIMDHKVLGREFKRGLQEGRQEGRLEGRQEGRQEGIQEGRQEGIQEGRQEGREEGERKILKRLLERRFGTIPEWVEQRLSACSEPEIEEFGVRLLDARSLEDLLK